jgi:hypothetical protein
VDEGYGTADLKAEDERKSDEGVKGAGGDTIDDRRGERPEEQGADEGHEVAHPAFPTAPKTGCVSRTAGT